MKNREIAENLATNFSVLHCRFPSIDGNFLSDHERVNPIECLAWNVLHLVKGKEVATQMVKITTDARAGVVHSTTDVFNVLWHWNDETFINSMRDGEDVRLQEDNTVFLKRRHGPDVMIVLVVKENVDEGKTCDCFTLPQRRVFPEEFIHHIVFRSHIKVRDAVQDLMGI